MSPTPEWLAQWTLGREKLRCPLDLNEYFSTPTIADRHLSVVDIGPCTLPSGRVLVRDPLCHLEQREAQPYFQRVPPGTYRTELCVILPDRPGDCARYAAARLCFSDRPAILFEEALVGDEPLCTLEEGHFFGFQVDAGLACICDEEVHAAFCAFVEQWRHANPGGNLYDDCFAPLFAASHGARPEYQRRGGDWVSFQVPGTDYRLPIFQSGFGDGRYPVYLGYDEVGAVCQLVVHLIPIAQAFDRPSSHLCPGDLTSTPDGLLSQVSLEQWDARFRHPGPYPLLLPGAASLTPVQEAGYDFLVLNQTEIYGAILTALFDLYPTLRSHYSVSAGEAAAQMPDVSTPEELANLLTPVELCFHPTERGGLPYIGYRFSCTWDREAGFGALLYGCRVVEVGDGAVALSRQLAEQDLTDTRTRGRKDELMTILRANSWEERHGNVYMSASYRGHNLFFYFGAFDEARLLHFEQEKLKRLMSRLEDLDRQAREIILRTRPGRTERDFPLCQVSISTDGSFHLCYEDKDTTMLLVEFDWDFRPTGAVLYNTY